MKKKQLTKIGMILSILLIFTSFNGIAAVFQEGIVTKKVWREGTTRKIEIDNEEYTLDSDMVIYKIAKNNDSESWDLKPTTSSSLKKGTEIWYKVVGYQLYDLYIKQ